MKNPRIEIYKRRDLYLVQIRHTGLEDKTLKLIDKTLENTLGKAYVKTTLWETTLTYGYKKALPFAISLGINSHKLGKAVNKLLRILHTKHSPSSL